MKIFVIPQFILCNIRIKMLLKISIKKKIIYAINEACTFKKTTQKLKFSRKLFVNYCNLSIKLGAPYEAQVSETVS